MRIQRSTQFGLALLLAISALHLIAPSAAQAARFITVRVERDGAAILESGFGAGDEEPRERLWGRLKDMELAEAGTKPLAPGKQDVTLEGNLRITISHADRELVVVKTDNLLLSRSPVGGRWRMPSAEVERTALQGGLDVTRLDPPEFSRQWLIQVVAAVAGGILIALAIALSMLWGLRRGTGSSR